MQQLPSYALLPDRLPHAQEGSFLLRRLLPPVALANTAMYGSAITRTLRQPGQTPRIATLQPPGLKIPIIAGPTPPSAKPSVSRRPAPAVPPTAFNPALIRPLRNNPPQ